ncbi:CoA ester lyase [Microbacterium soli]|uniref:CoA ester lyase n=1 Tax=Microbacterium soli TaxID=446075 RepID=A0ABP7N8E8_9MICO
MHPYRSMLFVPGHRASWVDKAVASGADAITLDLEDSVPQDLKQDARRIVRESIERLRTENVKIGVLVRVNGLATGQTGFDLEAVVGPGVDAIFAPKVESALDAQRFETLIDYFEARNGGKEIRLVIPMETARAVARCEEIASSTPRVGGILGSTAEHADIAREIGFEWTPEGLETLALRARVQVAARAAGVHPMTGLWERIHDLSGLREFALQGRRLGFLGQIAIHPSHVPIINEVYGPSPERRRFFEGLIQAYTEAAARGEGAVVYEGSHIDKAHLDKAREWLAHADLVEGLRDH